MPARRLLPLLLLLLLGSIGAQTTPMPVEPPRTRVLVMAGGGFHDFAGNLLLLLPGLEDHGDFAFTFLTLGPGLPQGDVGPEALADPGLQEEQDVILAYTQGELGLTAAQKAGLLRFVERGGGFVGLHCAADSHPGWSAYVTLLGGAFESHPPHGPFQVTKTPVEQFVSDGLPRTWDVTDEFYHLKNVTAEKRVLFEGTSPGDGQTRPVAWVRPFGEGRVFYTILGHGAATHADPRYQKMVARAVRWCNGP